MRLADALLLVGFVSASVGRGSTLRNQHNKAPRVDLDYATYEGTTQSSGINEFLGMRFVGSEIICLIPTLSSPDTPQRRWAAFVLGSLRCLNKSLVWSLPKRYDARPTFTVGVRY